MSLNVSYQTFFHRGIAIQASYGGASGDSYMVTLSHGTRAFANFERAKRYIENQLAKGGKL